MAVAAAVATAAAATAPHRRADSCCGSPQTRDSLIRISVTRGRCQVGTEMGQKGGGRGEGMYKEGEGEWYLGLSTGTLPGGHRGGTNGGDEGWEDVQGRVGEPKGGGGMGWHCSPCSGVCKGLSFMFFIENNCGDGYVCTKVSPIFYSATSPGVRARAQALVRECMVGFPPNFAEIFKISNSYCSVMFSLRCLHVGRVPM